MRYSRQRFLLGENTMKIAGLFPGQGSQSVGMGRTFYESNELGKEIFEQANKALGFSLSNLCFNGPIEELTLTKNAQPAILTTSYIAYTLADIPVSVAAGHSLGEYSALVAAKSISFEDAVSLVHKRGTYMQEAVEPGQGAMLAIIGPTPEEIQTIIDKVENGVVEIANLNCPGQTVVAGDVKATEQFSKLMSETGAKVIPLNVSAPFHCSLMKSAEEKLARDLDAISFNDPVFPIYANVTASAVRTAEEVRKCLKDQVCGSVRWTESIQNMITQESIEKTVEFGAGGVLTKLMKRIDKGIAREEVS